MAGRTQGFIGRAWGWAKGLFITTNVAAVGSQALEDGNPLKEAGANIIQAETKLVIHAGKKAIPAAMSTAGIVAGAASDTVSNIAAGADSSVGDGTPGSGSHSDGAFTKLRDFVKESPITAFIVGLLLCTGLGKLLGGLLGKIPGVGKILGPLGSFGGAAAGVAMMAGALGFTQPLDKLAEVTDGRSGRTSSLSTDETAMVVQNSPVVQRSVAATSTGTSTAPASKSAAEAVADKFKKEYTTPAQTEVAATSMPGTTREVTPARGG